MKRIVAILLIAAAVFALTACNANAVRGSVSSVTENGDAVLDIMPQKLTDKIAVGEMVVVTIGEFKEEMPIVEELIPEDGKLQLLLDREDWGFRVCIYNENFCEIYDVDAGDRVVIEKK